MKHIAAYYLISSAPRFKLPNLIKLYKKKKGYHHNINLYYAEACLGLLNKQKRRGLSNNPEVESHDLTQEILYVGFSRP